MHDEEAHRTRFRSAVHLHTANSDPLHIRHRPEQMRDLGDPNFEVSHSIFHIESVEVDDVSDGVEVVATSPAFMSGGHDLCGRIEEVPDRHGFVHHRTHHERER